MSSHPNQEDMLHRFLLNFYALHKNISNRNNKQLARELFLDQMKNKNLPSSLGYARFKKHYLQEYNQPLYQAYLEKKRGMKRTYPLNNATNMNGTKRQKTVNSNMNLL